MTERSKATKSFLMSYPGGSRCPAKPSPVSVVLTGISVRAGVGGRRGRKRRRAEERRQQARPWPVYFVPFGDGTKARTEMFRVSVTVPTWMGMSLPDAIELLPR